MRKIPSLSLSLYLDTGNTHPTSIKIQSKGLFSLSPFLLFYRWGVCTRLRPPPQQYKPYHIARPRMNRRDEKRPVKKRDRFFIYFFFFTSDEDSMRMFRMGKKEEQSHPHSTRARGHWVHYHFLDWITEWEGIFATWFTNINSAKSISNVDWKTCTHACPHD